MKASPVLRLLVRGPEEDDILWNGDKQGREAGEGDEGGQKLCLLFHQL